MSYKGARISNPLGNDFEPIEVYSTMKEQEAFIADRIKNNPDFFFPPCGGRPPKDEAIAASMQRYRDEEAAGKLTHRARWGGYRK